MSAIASSTMPDAQGHFGPYGGRYVPETLMHPLQELEEEHQRAQKDTAFQRELEYYLREFCGRPTPLYFAERLTRELGGAKIYLKREDLLHTGAQLGTKRGHDALPPGHGLWRACVSGHGGQFSAGHRRRSAPAGSGKGRALARSARGLRRRRVECNGTVLSVPRRRVGQDDGCG